jgi:SagB-type dehydrogenase family enzyme
MSRIQIIDTFFGDLPPPIWELFHENSKLTRLTQGIPNTELRNHLQQLYETLPYEGLPVFCLPKNVPLPQIVLPNALFGRSSNRRMKRHAITISQVSALLQSGYGVTRGKVSSKFPRSFRAVPSAGALYPLELFVHVGAVRGLPQGLYHYNPLRHRLACIQEGDVTPFVSKALVQTDIPGNASLVLFITTVFERSTFKYGDRGYRYMLFEAGHVAQNLNLVSNAFGLASVNIGGFFDHEIDALLQIDGITHSTIYMMALGKPTHSPNTSKRTKRRPTR